MALLSVYSHLGDSEDESPFIIDKSFQFEVSFLFIVA